MEIGQAIDYFSTVSIDGWDKANQKWVKDIAYGAYKTFDQFITNRSFGQKKRMLAVPDTCRIDMSLYQTVRCGKDLKQYTLLEENPDIRRDETYQYVYLMQDAEYECIIYEHQTTTMASGMQGSAVVTEIDRVWGDYERHSGTTRAGRDDVKLSLITFTLPANTIVNSDNLIDAGGDRYFIREVNRLLGYTDVLATKYGDG